MHSKIIEESTDCQSLASNATDELDGSDKSQMESMNVLIECLKYKNISRHLKTLKQSKNIGSPSTVDVSANTIAIGTVCSAILIFDKSENFKTTLTVDDDKYDASCIASISIFTDSSCLISGCTTGSMFVWNLETYSISYYLQLPQPYGVMSLKFSTDPALCYGLDTGGSVYSFQFSNILSYRSFKTTCIFSGCNGEVVSMQPMNSYPEYFIYESIELLALASVNHICVIKVDAEITFLFKFRLLNVESRTIPCVSWRFMKVRSAQQEPILKPFLLFSADNMLEIYRIKQIKTSEMVHEKFLSLKLDFDISAFHWPNSSSLILYSKSSIVYVMDISTKSIIESIDLSHVDIVGGFIGYRTIDKGISQYFKQYGNMLTIRQIGTHNFVFYILGIYGPFRLSLRKWDKRIEFLIERGEYEKVIIFIAELLSNKASCFFGQAIVKKARINLLDKARNILIIYSEKLLNFDNYFSIITFTKKIKFIIKIAFQVGISQVLFSEIYDIFSILEENHYKCNNKLNNSKELISQCKPILFDNITPFICKKSCIYINARFAREYLVYLIDNSNFELFNLIVPKIDMKCLDINLIIRTAKKYMLFDIIIYFYNVSLNDYITPFYEMFEVLISKYLQLYNGSNKVDDWNDDKSNCSGSLKKELDQVGNKLISYLTMCLNGIHLSPSYFFDYSELSEINSLEIKNSILRILVTYRSNNSEYDYPYIYFLLKFDSFQFCGMMECAFKSRIFGLENGIDDIQNVIDIMIEIIESNDFDSVTKQNFYNFLAQQLCIFKRQLTASMELIETIVEHLTLNHIDHLDRHETTIIKLIKNYGFEMFDVESLEKVCIERNFNLVREQIYMHQRKFDCIIYCYIEQGNEREKCIFKLISNLLSLKDLSREEAKKIKNALLINVEKLLAIDNFSATYTFVIECEISTETIMSYLKDDKTIYSFLDAIYNNRDRYFNDTSIAQNSIKRYIELKCDWDPSSVEHFFRDFTEYNTHECIKICYRKKNLMGSLYLLERIGGYSEAYRLLLQQISETIKSYQINVESDGVINENNALTKILQLTSEKLIFWESSVNDFNCKDLWFNLLNLFLEDRQFEDVSKIPIYRMSMCYLLKQLSNTTYYYDSLEYVFQSKAFRGKLGDIRDILNAIVGNFKHDQINATAHRNILIQDNFNTVNKLFNNMDVAVNHITTVCYYCNEYTELNQYNPIVYFVCLHVYHSNCYDIMCSYSKIRNPTSKACPKCLI